MITIKEIIEGIRCEECYPRKFGELVNDLSKNLYLYIDLAGNTRCFCKKHMSYGKKNSPGYLRYKDKHDYPLFGAELKSEILKRLD